MFARGRLQIDLCSVGVEYEVEQNDVSWYLRNYIMNGFSEIRRNITLCWWRDIGDTPAVFRRTY